MMRKLFVVAVCVLMFSAAGAALNGETYGSAAVNGGVISFNGSGEWVSNSFPVSTWKAVVVDVGEVEGSMVVRTQLVDEDGVITAREKTVVNSSGIHEAYIPETSTSDVGRAVIETRGKAHVKQVYTEEKDRSNSEAFKWFIVILGAAASVFIVMD